MILGMLEMISGKFDESGQKNIVNYFTQFPAFE